MGMGSKPKVPEPPKPAPVPTAVNPEVIAARQKNISDARRRAARNSSLLTSPYGLDDGTSTNKKTLLGV